MPDPTETDPSETPTTLPVVVVALPIADRRTAHDFYRAALGLDTIGEPADDGIAEPLQFVVNDGLRLMLVPSDGFGWTLGDGLEVAAREQVECVLSVTADGRAAVDTAVERAARAGATVVNPPEHQPWGYTGTFADPDGHLWQVLDSADA